MEANALVSLAIGALSPVSAASCASSVADRTMRPSAGTMSPASTWTMSPGTTWVAAISVTSPSRTTRACGTCILARASTLARAVSSWRVPSPTFSRMSSATMIPVETSPISRLTTTTATSIRFIGSRSCSGGTQTEGGFSAAISFAPYDESRWPPRRRKPAAASDAGRGDHLVRRERVRRSLCAGRRLCCPTGFAHRYLHLRTRNSLTSPPHASPHAVYDWQFNVGLRQ